MSEARLFEVPPPPRPGDLVQSPTLPLPPPRDRSELDRFLEDLSAVPVEDVASIRTMFAGFEDRESIATTLHEALRDRPCGDIGRFMLLLSTVGELADPSSLDPLHELVWTEDIDLLGYDPYRDQANRESSRCMFPASGMIQGRAAEMFAWIAAGREDHRLLQIITEHPSVVTRLAAADAFLFAHDDSAEALDRVLSIARPEDRDGIGVPRLVRGGDQEEFHQALEQAAHGRLPQRATVRARSSVHDSEGEN